MSLFQAFVSTYNKINVCGDFQATAFIGTIMFGSDKIISNDYIKLEKLINDIFAERLKTNFEKHYIKYY